MPEQIQVSETYLGWRGWRPARKKRLVTKWRYKFKTVETRNWGIVSIRRACEVEPESGGEKEYLFWEWGFNQIGESLCYDQVMVLDHPLRTK
jgi:hypothetical protein